jgi:hypothetical protein
MKRLSKESVVSGYKVDVIKSQDATVYMVRPGIRKKKK